MSLQDKLCTHLDAIVVNEIHFHDIHFPMRIWEEPEGGSASIVHSARETTGFNPVTSHMCC